MRNTLLPSSSQSQTQQMHGMPAVTTFDEHIPHASAVAENNKLKIPQRKNRRTSSPKIPFYVRNNDPNLQEFLIY